MTQGFDEWLFNHNHESIPEFSESAFKAGQQSRQAEIDELQKRIDEACMLCEKGCVLKAMEVLKGKKDE